MRRVIKLIAVCMALVTITAVIMTGCGKKNKSITIVSREDGSGTRGAFVELFGIEQKDETGKKIDHTSDTAEVTSSTAVMMTTIAGNGSAIGYISLGSLNDTVKALKIDGAEASIANIKDGSYKVARPFNIVTGKEVNELTADFIGFIMSSEGQEVVEANGYVSQDNIGSYAGSKPSGSIAIAGSSSVTPVMEKLKEEYLKLNTNASIEVQQNDSTIGVNSVIEGICDIGMASRELKQSELEKGVVSTVIAMDGIAVIVNKNNETAEMTSEQIRDIYMGKVTEWP